jgi:hypothetical protein
VRLTDAAILAMIVVQAIGGLAAGFWRSTRPERQPDATDLNALSRSASSGQRRARRHPFPGP